MNIRIGENIRFFRTRKDMTQEELAAQLGISFQSISKWERGEGYPDITMLPDLAYFFNVSVDELLGAEKMLGGGDFYNIYKLAHECETAGKYDEAIELLNATLKKYPNEYDLMAKLASVLKLLGKSEKPGNSGNLDEAGICAKKAVLLCERFLESDASEKAKHSAKAMLPFLYYDIDEYEKAKDSARKLPHIWESREVLFGEFLDGQEYIDYLKKMICAVLAVINEKIDSIASGEKINAKEMAVLSPWDAFDAYCDTTPEEKRNMITKIINFLD
jgi:transcriptional regulator with XRE-family HTH domain